MLTIVNKMNWNRVRVEVEIQVEDFYNDQVMGKEGAGCSNK